jgi:hypothetical protein
VRRRVASADLAMVRRMTADDELWSAHVKHAAADAFERVAGSDKSIDIEELVRWLSHGTQHGGDGGSIYDSLPASPSRKPHPTTSHTQDAACAANPAFGKGPMDGSMLLAPGDELAQDSVMLASLLQSSYDSGVLVSAQPLHGSALIRAARERIARRQSTAIERAVARKVRAREKSPPGDRGADDAVAPPPHVSAEQRPRAEQRLLMTEHLYRIGSARFDGGGSARLDRAGSARLPRERAGSARPDSARLPPSIRGVLHASAALEHGHEPAGSAGGALPPVAPPAAAKALTACSAASQPSSGRRHSGRPAARLVSTSAVTSAAAHSATSLGWLNSTPAVTASATHSAVTHQLQELDAERQHWERQVHALATRLATARRRNDHRNSPGADVTSRPVDAGRSGVLNRATPRVHSARTKQRAFERHVFDYFGTLDVRTASAHTRNELRSFAAPEAMLHFRIACSQANHSGVIEYYELFAPLLLGGATCAQLTAAWNTLGDGLLTRSSFERVARQFPELISVWRRRVRSSPESRAVPPSPSNLTRRLSCTALLLPRTRA